MSVRWPSVDLSPVRRLRVLAASIPGTQVRERVMDAPFDAVWSVATDFEGSVHRFEPLVASARILSREGERLVIETRTPWLLLGLRTRLDVLVRPGFCWMQDRRGSYVVGMAAEALPGGRTLFVNVEGVPRRGGGVLRPLVARFVDVELRRLERLARREEARRRR